MIGFLVQNWGTILTGAFVIGCITLAVHNLRKDKKAGRSSCGCGCSQCPNAGTCHKIT